MLWTFFPNECNLEFRSCFTTLNINYEYLIMCVPISISWWLHLISCTNFFLCFFVNACDICVSCFLCEYWTLWVSLSFVIDRLCHVLALSLWLLMKWNPVVCVLLSLWITNFVCLAFFCDCLCYVFSVFMFACEIMWYQSSVIQSPFGEGVQNLALRGFTQVYG